jgi:anti-anti-sigma factor
LAASPSGDDINLRHAQQSLAWATHSSMWITRFSDDRVILALLGEPDADTASILSSAITDAALGAPAIEIDCSGLTILDSSGVDALLSARRAAQTARPGLPVYLTSLTSSAARDLDVLGLRAILTQRDNRLS